MIIANVVRDFFHKAEELNAQYEELVGLGVIQNGSMDLTGALTAAYQYLLDNNKPQPLDGFSVSPRYDVWLRSFLETKLPPEKVDAAFFSYSRRFIHHDYLQGNPPISEAIRDMIIFNGMNARFSARLIGLPGWFANEMTRSQDGSKLYEIGKPLPGVIAFPSDLVFPNGEVRWKAPSFSEAVEQLIVYTERNYPARPFVVNPQGDFYGKQ